MTGLNPRRDAATHWRNTVVALQQKSQKRPHVVDTRVRYTALGKAIEFQRVSVVTCAEMGWADRLLHEAKVLRLLVAAKRRIEPVSLESTRRALSKAVTR